MKEEVKEICKKVLSKLNKVNDSKLEDISGVSDGLVNINFERLDLSIKYGATGGALLGGIIGGKLEKNEIDGEYNPDVMEYALKVPAVRIL